MWIGLLLQPDLLFVVAERTGIISEQGIEGTPDLVVEIISPSTSWRDMKMKLPLYEETSVSECWIVDPKKRTIDVHVLEGKSYTLLGHWESGEAARSRVIEGFQVAVNEVMRDQKLKEEK